MATHSPTPSREPERDSLSQGEPTLLAASPISFSACWRIEEETRLQIEKEGAAATFYARVRLRDLKGALMAIEASPTPIPIDETFVEQEIVYIKDSRIIEALIHSGVPLLSEPNLYRALIRAERYTRDEPELVKALVKNGLGPLRLEGALSLACEAFERHDDGVDQPSMRVVELLLAAGACVYEREAQPLKLAVAFKNAQLTRLLCGADSYGTAIRKTCFMLGAQGPRSKDDLLFLLASLDPLQRYEGLEHALDGALETYVNVQRSQLSRTAEPSSFAAWDEARISMSDLVRTGARGHRLSMTDGFDWLTFPPCHATHLRVRAMYVSKLYMDIDEWEGDCRDRFGDTTMLRKIMEASDAQDIRDCLRRNPSFRDESGNPLEVAADVHDFEEVRRQTFRGLFEREPSLRDDAASPLEVAVTSGNLELVKFFVEQLKVNVNENLGTPLIVVAQEGYVDILEYLLSKSADITLQNHKVLIEAVRFANAEVVRLLLERGANVRVDNDYPVYLCAINSTEAKRGPALECAKHLVESGANPRVFGLPLDVERGPAAEYLFLMSEVMDPGSSLYIQAIDPRFTKEHINFKDPHYRRSHVYRYLSNCAAVSASLGDISMAREFFVSFLQDGAHKVFNEKRGRFKDLAESTSAALSGYQDLRDIGMEFALDVILPRIVCQWPQHSQEALGNVVPIDLISAVSQHLYPEAVCILFKDRPVLDILRLNKLWHRDDKRMPLEAHPLRADASWYPLIPDITLPSGFSLHALTDNKALAREGSALHHCIGKGNYATACLSGQSHLFSLRLNSEPVATIQFTDSKTHRTPFPLSNGRFVALKQFRGAYNHRPSNEALRAFGEFEDLVIKQLIVLRGELLGETHESIARRQRGGISTLEFITGIKLGESPTAALRHYSDHLTISPTKDSPSNPALRIPLLRSGYLEEGSYKASKSFLDNLMILTRSPNEVDSTRKVAPPH